MRFRVIAGPIAGFVAAILLLAACENREYSTASSADGATSVPTVTNTLRLEAVSGPLISRSTLARLSRPGFHPAWMRLADNGNPDTKGNKAGVYVSQFYGSEIGGYKSDNEKNSAPVCEVPSVEDVNGIATDQTGKLYVPQELQSQSGGSYGEITVYAPNCGKHLKTLTSDDPMLNAAVDGTTVYGMDNVGAGPTLVSVYANGSTSPTSFLKGPTSPSGYSTINGYAIAVDSQHNVFVSVYAPDSDWNAEVIEFPGGQMPATQLSGTLWIDADFPAGVLVDKQNNLLMVNPVNNSSVAIYAPPYTGSAIATIVLNGAASYCALNHTEKLLYCTDYQYGSVDVYKYPSGLYLYSFTNGLNWNNVPEGIALKPAAPL